MTQAAQHQGHRARLREKFLKTTGEGLADYELLELLLFSANPRSDTKPLAKNILSQFGSLHKALDASPEQLRQISGMGDTAICLLKVCQKISIERLQLPLMESPLLDGWNQVATYCQAQMSHLTREQFRILFLDHAHRLIKDEVQQTGTVNQTPIYVREIIHRALELGASGLILVHNHPTGDPTPSSADIEITRQIQEACKHLNLTVLDHLIIGKGCYVSFKARQLIV